MLGVFSDGVEVIVCEVNGDDEPISKDWFSLKSERNKEDFDYALVDGPVCMKSGSPEFEAERTLKREPA